MQTETKGLLPKEIKQRQQQYEYYRTKLFAFNTMGGVNDSLLIADSYLNILTEAAKLADVKLFYTRYKKLYEVTCWDKRFSGVEKHKQVSINKFFYYQSSDLLRLACENGDIKILTTYKSNLFTKKEHADHIYEKEIICIPSGGNAIVQYYNGKFITADNRIATSLDPNKLSIKFLYYVLLNKIDLISSYYRGSGIKHPDMTKILEIDVPIPSLEIQENIIKFLDKFEYLIIETKGLLPKEIAYRQKQYEYYREKLLTFK